jgi:hypothetical protein
LPSYRNQKPAQKTGAEHRKGQIKAVEMQVMIQAITMSKKAGRRVGTEMPQKNISDVRWALLMGYQGPLS